MLPGSLCSLNFKISLYVCINCKRCTYVRKPPFSSFQSDMLNSEIINSLISVVQYRLYARAVASERGGALSPPRIPFACCPPPPPPTFKICSVFELIEDYYEVCEIGALMGRNIYLSNKVAELMKVFSRINNSASLICILYIYKADGMVFSH